MMALLMRESRCLFVCVRVRWSRVLSVEGCMVGVDVVVQYVVVAGVAGRFGSGCPMLVGLA